MKKSDKKNIEDILSLTPMQEGMLFHYLKDPESDHYFEQLSLKITGEVNLEGFKKAWDYVIQVNEMLRTFFRWEKLDSPAQVVLRQHNPDLGFFDLSDIEDHAKKQKQLEKIKLEDRKEKFDLREVPFRVILCKVSEKDYHIVISNHHILYDGWSSGIILKEFFRVYARLEEGETSLVLPVKPSFKEFVRWHQNRDKDKQKKFWEEYFKGFDTQTRLPIKRKSMKINKVPGGTPVKEFGFTLEKGISDRLDTFLKKHRITLAAFFYCSWGILLQKYCSSDDVVFGTTVSGRSAPINGIENMVGLFINTLPLRVTAKTGENVLDLLLKINEILTHREKYENTPLVDIREYSQRETSQELFDSLLVMENYPLELPMTVHSYSANESTNYDLNIAIALHGSIKVRLIYSEELFAEDVILRLSRHFIRILDEITVHPRSPFHAINILSREEKKQLLLDFNDIGPAFPNDKTIHGLFEEQVEKTTDNIALHGCMIAWMHGEDVSITYKEINEKSNQLAYCLLEKWVKPGNLVGITVERSIEMIIGILGILKAGCAYVPLNPKAPTARHQFILADCNIQLLLTNCVVNDLNKMIEVIDLTDLVFYPGEGNMHACSSDPHLYLKPAPVTSLAYVIYTSGSTGKPKGVPITHSNFSPLVHWGYKHLGLGPSDRSARNLSNYFDWSVWEMFIALTSGASLYMVSGEVVLNSERYIDFIHRHAITVLHITPTHFQSLIRVSSGGKLNTLKYLCIGAEKLNCDLVERSYEWINEGCRVFNMYGPTEATIMAAVLEINKTKLPFYRELSGVPIGETLGNTVLLVLDRHFNPCPLYVPGELYIGGDGVSRGYLNNPELTAEKFTPQTFTDGTQTNFDKKFFRGSRGAIFQKSPPGRRRPLGEGNLYRTGDLTRWLPDGIVEFLGRIDQQVKIRGFRIEPGEIEKHLLEHIKIKEALVIAREYENGERYLCAYVVSHSSWSSHLSNTLKEYLSGQLPDYMVPSYFLALEKMPLNPNGKVDLKALPEPTITSAKGYIAPMSDRERTLVGIWSRVLGFDAAKIGIDDDFFELGGHSLNVTAVIGRIHKEMNMEVPFTEIFVNPTVRELAEYISQKEESQHCEIPLAEEKEYYPLSSAQKRLFVLQQMEVDCTAYNINGIMGVEGPVEKEKFETVFRQLINRHESLRTSFQMIEEQPVQKIHDKVEFEIEYYDSQVTGAGDRCKWEEDTKKNINGASSPGTHYSSFIIHHSFIRPFDLSHAPLLRMGLIKKENKKHILIVDMHHIISDGTSMGVFIKEFISVYQGEKMLLPGIRYRDFSEWQNRRKENETIKTQEAYWLQQFQEEVPLLDLPLDFIRPAFQSFTGEHISFEIKAQKTEALKAFALEENATLYMVLLAVFNIFLSKLTSQEYIVIGTPSLGRNHIDLLQIIGMFVNTLALSNYPSGEKGFKEFLRELRVRTTADFENQDYQFEELVEKVSLNRDAGRNPLFDAAFTLQDLDIPEIGTDGLKLKPYSYNEFTKTAKFDLFLNGTERDGGITFVFEYRTDLFRHETIQRFTSYFKRVIDVVVENGEIRLSQIEIISEQEKKQLLVDFNYSETPFPQNKSLDCLFEEQVEKSPHNVALIEQIPNSKSQIPNKEGVFGEVHLSYRELNESSNRVVGKLREKGIKPDTIVGIIVERSLKMIIGILGISKAGGAYLPIDPGCPEQRIGYMLTDSDVNMLVTTQSIYEKVEKLRSWQGEVLFLDNTTAQYSMIKEPLKETCSKSGLYSYLTQWSSVSSPGQMALAPPASLAYIIYTSGSTGKPKGVMVEHRNAVNVVSWFGRKYNLSSTTHVMLMSDYTFDPSVNQVFGTLLRGAVLYIIQKDLLYDSEKLRQYIAKHQIHILNSVPVMLNELFCKGQRLESIQAVISGGEKLDEYVKDSIISKGYSLYNQYGPSETTIDALVARCTEDKVTLGKPIANVRCYILDKYEKPVSIGVVGELYIGGAGVARGYLGRVELTAEKFLRTCYETEADGRMYKTGDLARWLPDGNVEFFGRMDRQVKVRGYRIELDEIEKAVMQYKDKDIEFCIAKIINGDQIVAYIKKHPKIILRPSWAEQFVYDDMAYLAMSTDENRNQKYKNVFNRVLKGKEVLEIGPGPDICLTRFCIEAGAKKVYAVEILQNSYIKAKQKIESLGLGDKIELLLGDVTKILLPRKVDYCVSEIVGSIGGMQGAAKIINTARKILKNPGNMIPSRSLTKIAAVTLPDSSFDYRFDEVGAHYTKRIFEKTGYKFDLRLCLHNFSKGNIISTPDTFEDLNFREINQLEFEHDIYLEITTDSILCGFIAWLNLYIDEQEVIDTMEGESLWLPLYLPVFPGGIPVRSSDYIKGQVARKLSRNNLNPDYLVKGVLYQKDGKQIDFFYHSFNEERIFRSNVFYKKVFKDNGINLEVQGGTDDIKKFLSKLLPTYMIPSYFVTLEQIPLTTSGKIDLKALPEPEVKKGIQHTAPRDRVEEKLAEIWADVLGIEKDNIGIDSDFFELGGHSLKATLLTAKIHKEFHVKVPLVEIFKTPFIRGLAVHISEAAQDKYISLEPAEKKEYYALSSGQKRLYVLQQMDEQGMGYNIPSVWNVEGDIDKVRFEKVFRGLIKRHESLRTSFHLVNDVVQRIHEENPNFQITMPLSIKKAGAVSIPNIKSQIPNIIKDFIRPFDLSQAPLLRVGLVELEAQSSLLMIDIHHIVSDGTSMGLLVDDFISLYKGEGLSSLRLQYRDYTQWQNHRKESELIKKQEAYWLKEFNGEIPLLNMPTDVKRPMIQSFAGKTLVFDIGEEKAAKLKTLALKKESTLFMVLLSLFNILLSKLSSQEDIVVGTPVANRRYAGLESIMGMFVNTLTLQNSPVGEKTVTRFLKEVKERSLTAFENQEYPFEDLVEKIPVNRDTGRNPLFDVMFDLQPISIDKIEIPGLKLEPYNYTTNTAKFDLMLQVVEEEENLRFIFEYSTKLFKDETIRRFIGFFKKIAEVLVENPALQLAEIDIVSEEDRQQILMELNDTETEYPKDKVIHQLFEEQVERIPDHVALTVQIPNSKSQISNAFGGKVSLTYKELNKKSDQLAHLLIEKGVKPDTVAALMIERSIEMIVGILGILKAGGAYLPIDPDYPEERITYMLKDSSTKVLLTDTSLSETFEKLSIVYCQLLMVNEKTPGCRRFNIPPKEANSINSYQLTTNNLQLEPANLAYIIYTSGTTGKPKGVMIQHGNVVRLMFNDKFQFDFNNTDVWTMFHSYCFDFSVWEMYGALLYGGKLVIIPKTTARDAQRYLEVLKEEKVTILNQTPSAFYNLINMELQNPGKGLYIRWVIFGGEALTPVRLKEWKAKYPETKLINMYGITETTVHVTFKKIKDKEIASTASSIGKPIPTLSTYVLDKALKLLPIGVPGELCVGGKGVGRGYLNQPELTGDKFINNPYIPGERLYRSGDLVKMSARGDMEYLGRMDHQVKIRGFRIELAEIESQLLSHGEVEDVVVMVKENNVGDKHLCAYVASHQDGLTAPGLREYLLKKLPGYMVPSFFIFLEGIPLTPNGKIDRKALPEPEIKAGKGYTAPRNEVEEKLVRIWAETLGIPQNTIGIDCNFFELGGHSLKAALLVSKVHKALDVSVSLVEIFSTPTIRELAAYIKKAAKDKYISIKPVEKKEYYTLSSAQGRLYVLHRMDEQGIGYNIPSVWNVEGDIDPVKFEKVFRELIRRHESLRTSFHVVHEEPVQKTHDEVEFEIEYDQSLVNGHWSLVGEEEQTTEDRRQTTEEKKQTTDDRGQTKENRPGTHLSSVIRHLSSEFIRPFDLSQAPLLRVGLAVLEKERYLLMVDMHHIITDGTSMGVFVKDFMSLYRKEKLPSLRVQYKEFSRWQKSGGVKASLKEQEEYWLREFPGEIPVLDLPIDHARPLVQVFEGNTLGFELNKEETGKLKTLAREQDITLFMLLFCAYTMFLTKLSGQEDIVVGSPVAGRRHADLEPVIGMFVNTLALRSFPASGKAFGQFLREVKERTLAAFENQDYPFEELVEQVDVNRDTSRNPLFDTMFVLQNTDTTDIDTPGLKLSPYKREDKTSKFDLTLSGSEVEDKLLFTFEYSTKLFKEATIGRFIRYFRKTLYTVLEKPYIPLSGIEIISGEEKQQILFEFNDTRADYPQNKTIHELFEEQADRTPDGVAVVGAHELHEFHEKEKRAVGDTQGVGMTAARLLKGFIASVTYCELNRKASQLARLLRIKGALANDIAAIMVERSIEMVIGILGILKAGGAYLPVDPGYPRKRIDYMLKDSSVKVLVTINTLKEEVEKLKSDEIEQIFSTSQPLNFSTSQPSHPAYVIYTSGSTGKPRGVLVEHQSVVNLVFSLKDKIYHYGQSEPAALISPIVFDASIKQIFTNLVWGNRLVIVPEEIRPDGKELVRFYKRHDIKISDGTPIHLDILLNDASGSLLDWDFPVKRFAIGGDTLKYSTAEALFRAISHSGHGVKQESVELINVYGPTECCDVTAVYAVTRGTLDKYHFLPIGKPLENTSAYIMGKTGELQPIGIAGELCIGRKGLARGYLNRPELTAERFDRNLWDFQDYQDEKQKEKQRVPGKNYKDHMQSCSPSTMQLSPNHSPHYPIPPLPHRPIYRTGDLARWLPDGNIEFLGRIDSQVKIRGFRVELGEIESQLLMHSEIKEAVVVSREENRGIQQYLCGYFVADRNVPPPELREYLLKTLPDYMIPSYFGRVKKIPTTPSGKLDKKALPAPEIKAGEGYVPPRNKMEEKLVGIWAEVLSLEKDKIGIHDSFFQLGGHSLKAILLISRIHKELNVKVPLAKVFQTSSISGLAGFIKGAEEYKFFPLEKAEKKEYYPLSSSQMRLYILQQMVPETTGYNMPTMMTLKGEIDRDKFEKTFMKLIGRHESLRTSFEIVKSETVQCIHDEVEFEIEYYNMEEVEVKDEEQTTEDRRQKTEEKRQTKDDTGQTTENRPGTHLSSVIRHLSSEFIRPFDLSHAPLLRVGLLPAPCSLPSASSILMLDIHHIISDGISNNLLINDFMALYAGKVLPDLRIQYKDFSEWQISIQQGESIKHQEEYWLKEFAGELPVLNLPMDYVRPVVQDFEGTTLEFELGKEDTLALKSLAYEQGATLYMTLLSLYTIFLSKITNQEDIVVGTPVAGRRHADLENIIGVFVNTLALRNFPLPGKTFAQFLAEVKKRSLESFAHQDYPYEDLVEAVVVQRDTSRNPLFDTMFVMHNIGVTEMEIPGMKLSRYDYETRISKFDLSLYSMESNEKLVFSFEYSTKLFKSETVERFIEYFVNIIREVVENSQKVISDFEFITEEEKMRILFAFNDTEREYPKNKTIHRLFEEQVERTPDNIAVIGPCLGAIDESTHQMTYRELDEKSSRLAQLLREKGIEVDRIAAIVVDRSNEMIIGIMGILKSGGAYLPINPQNPAARIKYMLEDSGANVLVTTGTLVEKVKKVEGLERKKNIEIILLDFSTLLAFYSSTLPSYDLHLSRRYAPATCLTYIIYTSGSTGEPKGVPITHANLSPLLHWGYGLGLGSTDRVIQNLSYFFDWSVWEILITLTTGASLHVANLEVILNPVACAEFITWNAITVLHITPTQLQYLLNTGRKLETLKYLFIGAEKLPYDTVRRSYRVITDDCRVYNMYGPTEATIISAVLPIDPEVVEHYKELPGIPIGKPVANLVLLVLDKYLHLCPVGVAGELYISGGGVARGYLNNPELTAEKFGRTVIRHSSLFVSSSKKLSKDANDRLYLTGDLVFWLPDGNVLFLGRIDHQVKIRGFRIELGEIENRLLQHVEIEDTVVLAKQTAKKRGQDSEYQLYAYIVSGKTFTIPELREFLSNELPDYMLPSYFVQVEKIPLTPNGKVDRKILETYDTEVGSGVEYAAPGNSFEEKITDIWKEELNVNKIGIYDNFFELGGNSMNIVKISNRLKEITGKTISVMTLFRYPTVHLLSQYVSQENMENTFSDEKIGESVQMMEDTALMFLEEDDE